MIEAVVEKGIGDERTPEERNPLLPSPAPDDDDTPPEIVGDRRLLKVPTVAKRLQFRTKIEAPYRPDEIVLVGGKRYQACAKGKTLRRIQ